MTGLVRLGAAEYPLDEARGLSFGRSRDCTICLDPTDPAVSRIAGDLAHRDGVWWLTNRSTSRPLSVVDDLGLRSVLPPGRRTAVETPTGVLVDGVNNRQYHLFVVVGGKPPGTAPVPAGTGVPTATGAEVLVNSADRLAMVALFAGYLEDPPRYDPYPKSYAAAAARLGWPRTTLVKRVEYLRARLDAAGVPNMTGFNALVNLAEYAISRGLITRADLALLRRS